MRLAESKVLSVQGRELLFIIVFKINFQLSSVFGVRLSSRLDFTQSLLPSAIVHTLSGNCPAWIAHKYDLVELTLSPAVTHSHANSYLSPSATLLLPAITHSSPVAV
jgi:hypothetical protein